MRDNIRDVGTIIERKNQGFLKLIMGCGDYNLIKQPNTLYNNGTFLLLLTTYNTKLESVLNSYLACARHNNE